ncbi:serine hydrolase domain-containing protein [Caulobacter mirabilis]|uniref:Serine hydrolase n=1 Tax=Caulobacter mirabilis TaxID=69666 RepID=A0A2D2AXP3_9CAUL|nr:serine hydrolase domain-containing protein [Caulobacter mirabilis]ATQ42755.1 serine hydrolase [Caulobacter mirabilis]
MLRRSLSAAMAAVVVAWVLAPGPSQAQEGIDLPSAKPEAVGFSSERLKRLDYWSAGFVERGYAPGIATVVIRHGKVVSTNIYGKADVATGAPLKSDAIWRMYSQTKPVTGVAMMILYEQGKWKLDDPITKYVPEFANLRVFKGVGKDGKPITEPVKRTATMRELMSHAAGFAYGLSTDNYVDKAYRDSGMLGSATLGQVMTEAAKLPLYGQPGEQWKYSIAVDIQGYIVEKLSGQTLPDFMQSHIFGPLKMKDTAFWVPEDKRGRMASLYAIDPKTKKIVPAEGFMVLPIDKVPTAPNGGGGLVSTMSDYSRFAAMLAGGGQLDGVRILSPSTIKLMASNHLSDKVLAQEPLGPGTGFGLDVAVIMDPARAGTTAGKGSYSWGGAAGTWFWVDPENDVAFLGFIQVIGGSAYRLDERSAQLLYQALVEPEK